jgi:hypothetical protein
LSVYILVDDEPIDFALLRQEIDTRLGQAA